MVSIFDESNVRYDDYRNCLEIGNTENDDWKETTVIVDKIISKTITVKVAPDKLVGGDFDYATISEVIKNLYFIDEIDVDERDHENDVSMDVQFFKD